MNSFDAVSQVQSINPDPDEWLSKERLEFVNEKILPIFDFLQSANLLNDILSAWVKFEVLKEVDPSDSNTSKPLNDQEKLLYWCHVNWKHKLENLYLQKKDELDMVDCRLLNVSDKNLAFELFYRLKAGEASFDELSIRYGTGPERFRGGLYEKQPLSTFPKFLRKVLQSSSPGELVKPFRSGNKFTILLLEKWSAAVFDTETHNRLLLLEFKDWQQGIIVSIRRRLEAIK